jgi:hypothetical protein
VCVYTHIVRHLHVIYFSLAFSPLIVVNSRCFVMHIRLCLSLVSPNQQGLHHSSYWMTVYIQHIWPSNFVANLFDELEFFLLLGFVAFKTMPFYLDYLVCNYFLVTQKKIYISYFCIMFMQKLYCFSCLVLAEVKLSSGSHFTIL